MEIRMANRAHLIGDDWIATEDDEIVHLRYVHRIYLREHEPPIHPRKYRVVADLPGIRVNLTRPTERDDAVRALQLLAERLTNPLKMAILDEADQ